MTVSERLSERPSSATPSVKRRNFIQQALALAVVPAAFGSRSLRDAFAIGSDDSQGVPKLVKSDAAWRQILPRDAYDVLRDEDTERPFSSRLDQEKRAGTFVCAGCYLPLFSSADKFDSGTGWPSFTRPIAGHVATKRDFKLILPRKEYHCARCEGHQGHVFDDGPRPRGERWCNNGVALVFVPTGDALPALRT